MLLIDMRLNHGKHGIATEDTENGLSFFHVFSGVSVISAIQ